MDCSGEDVPLAVVLARLILGILPFSLLPTVVTLLDVPGAATGVCIVFTVGFGRCTWGSRGEGTGGACAGGCEKGEGRVRIDEKGQHEQE